MADGNKNAAFTINGTVSNEYISSTIINDVAWLTLNNYSAFTDTITGEGKAGIALRISNTYSPGDNVFSFNKVIMDITVDAPTT